MQGQGVLHGHELRVTPESGQSRGRACAAGEWQRRSKNPGTLTPVWVDTVSQGSVTLWFPFSR